MEKTMTKRTIGELNQTIELAGGAGQSNERGAIYRGEMLAIASFKKYPPAEWASLDEAGLRDYLIAKFEIDFANMPKNDDCGFDVEALPKVVIIQVPLPKWVTNLIYADFFAWVLVIVMANFDGITGANALLVGLAVLVLVCHFPLAWWLIRRASK